MVTTFAFPPKTRPHKAFERPKSDMILQLFLPSYGWDLRSDQRCRDANGMHKRGDSVMNEASHEVENPPSCQGKRH